MERITIAEARSLALAMLRRAEAQAAMTTTSKPATCGRLVKAIADEAVLGDDAAPFIRGFDVALAALIESKLSLKPPTGEITMFDKTTIDSLIAALEAGEADLAAKTDANVTAQTAAGAAAAALAGAQATNKSNVAALKAYVATLDDAGNVPPAPPAAAPAAPSA